MAQQSDSKYMLVYISRSKRKSYVFKDSLVVFQSVGLVNDVPIIAGLDTDGTMHVA